jgi:hypothetical protein
MNTRQLKRKKLQDLKKKVENDLRKTSVKEFQDNLRKFCFIDDEDRLIIEMINGSEFIKTEKLSVSELTSFHNIYEKTGSVFKHDYTPSIYLNISLKNFNILNDKLSYQISNEDIPNLFINNELMCYTLDSKMIRMFYSTTFGYRSGYSEGNWNDLTSYHFINSKSIFNNEYITGIQKFQLLNTIGKIETPLGMCINL